ncbi:MAG: autotransporter domain-containing protein [Legionellaceae bacterium]|nr:autotransporter domain-containing protein [Legionellaceae bacterium]
MDTRKNKTLFHEDLKRLMLKATTSAIITLNAETVTASCLTYITGTSSSCTFDTGSSVTVGNNGTVIGSINMTSYSAPPPSYITVDAGGSIMNNTGVGINISSSFLSNGISNSGTISTANTGIVITNTSTISGGISNSGVMDSTTGIGINITNASTINGSISNSGTMNNTNGIGINISNGTLISDGISNTGEISTWSSGISIANTNVINGSIFNSGIISSANGTGIKIANGNIISGSILNSGTIQAGSNFSAITIDQGSDIGEGITNSGLIEANEGNSILIRSNSAIMGDISNSGTIRSLVNTGIAVFNSAAIQGNISNSGLISGGLKGISIHDIGTVSENILNNGTISGGMQGISIYNLGTVSGSIINNDTIRSDQSGISILSSAVVQGGISNSGTIQGDIYAIKIVNSNVSNLDIIGQSARIIGEVDASDTTVNITNNAIFTSEGIYHVDLFNIASNALFNMANTITTSALDNAGTLAVANTLQTIVGDYIQQTGGLFQTEVSSTSDYGQLLVNGSVDLLQSGDIDVRVTPNTLLHNGDVLSDVIKATGVFNAPVNGWQVSDNNYIWTFIPSLNQLSNGLNLTATINPDAYTACQGTYCQGAATTILEQVAAGNPLFYSYTTLASASALSEAASQATPELTNENIQVLQLITRAVWDIVPMWDTLRGKSSGDAMLYQPGKIWIKPYGASMSQNERNTVPGFNATAYGAVIGTDIQLANDWLLGAGFAAGGDNMHGKAALSGQSINSQAYQGMVYGTKKLPNHVYFAGQGLVGYEMNDTTRSIPLYASTAKGSYNSWFTNLRAEMGWSTYALSPNFVFTPELDASYLFINQNGYQESGSLMDLSVASNHNSSFVLGANGNGAYRLTNIHNQYDLTLTGYVGFAGDVINSQPEVASTFVAGGSSFTTFGVQFNGVVFRGGAGLALTSPTNPLIIEVNYDLQVGNNAYSGVGAATIKYKT